MRLSLTHGSLLTALPTAVKGMCAWQLCKLLDLPRHCMMFIERPCARRLSVPPSPHAPWPHWVLPQAGRGPLPCVQRRRDVCQRRPDSPRNPERPASSTAAAAAAAAPAHGARRGVAGQLAAAALGAQALPGGRRLGRRPRAGRAARTACLRACKRTGQLNTTRRHVRLWYGGPLHALCRQRSRTALCSDALRPVDWWSRLHTLGAPLLKRVVSAEGPARAALPGAATRVTRTARLRTCGRSAATWSDAAQRR